MALGLNDQGLPQVTGVNVLMYSGGGAGQLMHYGRLALTRNPQATGEGNNMSSCKVLT